MNYRITNEGYIDTNPPPDQEKALYTLEELCARFQVNERTLRKWLRRDNIPRHRRYNPVTCREVAAVKWGDILDASKRSTRWPLA